MSSKAKLKVLEHRQYQITAEALSTLVGREFGIDTRGAWLELVSDDDEACDECGRTDATVSWAVRLVLPFRDRTVEVG